MEVLLLFCCQSCLKGDEDIEYYTRLAVNQNASLDDIKKAYKKRSLQLHPDRLAQRGVQITPEHNQEFQKLKEAYDVLSDPRKRKLYDKIGKSGLKLVESPQELNPTELIKNFQQNRSDRFKIVLLLFFIFSSILILPILFCLKIDGKIDDVPWLALWTPMWIVDSIMVITSILFLMEKDEDPEEDEENPHPKEKPEKIPLYVKLLFAGRTFAYILLQIFILMSLDQEINWSWFAIFAPWFAFEFLAFLDKLPILMEDIPEPNIAELERQYADLDDQEKTMNLISKQEEYFKKLMEKAITKKSMVITILRVWLACFLAVQLDQTVNWDWGLVLLPIWCYFVVEIIHSYLLKKWGTSLLIGIDLDACERGEVTDPSILLRAQHGQELQAAGSMGICAFFPVLYMAILLISRLEASVFSTFIILIPVFVVLGCCMCGVICGICALSCVDMTEMDGQPTGEGHESVPVPTNSFGNSDDLEAQGSSPSRPQEKETQLSQKNSVAIPIPIVEEKTPVSVAPPEPSSALEVTHIDADID